MDLYMKRSEDLIGGEFEDFILVECDALYSVISVSDVPASSLIPDYTAPHTLNTVVSKYSCMYAKQYTSLHFGLISALVFRLIWIF